MLALAIETSHLPGSIALVERVPNGEHLLGDMALPATSKTAQSLVPAIRDLLAAADKQPKHIQLVAVSHGPGSFTGLRIGVTCAKTFAYAAGAEGMGIDTLRACAAQASEELTGERPVEAVVSAQRGELFVARYASHGGTAKLLEAPHIIAIEAWLASLSEDVFYTGPGLSKIAARLPERIATAKEASWMPRAATVARLALADHAAGVRHEVLALAPQYFRPSYAEEKRA